MSQHHALVNRCNWQRRCSSYGSDSAMQSPSYIHGMADKPGCLMPIVLPVQSSKFTCCTVHALGNSSSATMSLHMTQIKYLLLWQWLLRYYQSSWLNQRELAHFRSWLSPSLPAAVQQPKTDHLWVAESAEPS